MEAFNELYQVNVNNYTEEKNGLTYLTWSYAWAEVKKRYPGATYEIEKFENNLPYVYDENTGYMVFTKVTIEGLTYEMWLPVMDSANKTMKSEPYTYDTKFKKGLRVESATMFDINKTIMRCLVKNLAMFGLGLYIYSGEDLPTQLDEVVVEKITGTQAQALQKSIENNNIAKDQVDLILEEYGYKEIDDIKKDDYSNIVKKFQELVGVTK